MNIMHPLRLRFFLTVVISVLLTITTSIAITLAIGGQLTWIRIALLALCLVPLMAIVLGYLLIVSVRQPMQVLIGVAQKVQANRIVPEDLRHLNQIALRRDDIGQLARVLHDMARVIPEREQHMSEEIAQLQAKVSSNNPQVTDLEMAYYEALRKKSAWLRQQLPHRGA